MIGNAFTTPQDGADGTIEGRWRRSKHLEAMEKDVAKIDLNGKSRAQLEKLLADIDKEMSRRAVQNRKDALAAARAAVKPFGYTLEALMDVPGKGRRKKRGPKGAQPAKYRDPNSAKTWSGMGRRPAWFVAHVDGGKDAAELLIQA